MKFEGKYLLALNAHPKIGSQTLKKILAAFDNPESVWNLPAQKLKQRLEEKFVSLILESRAKYNPDTELDKLKKLDLGYMTMYDESYPSQLLELPDCPAVLYIKGNDEVLKTTGLGVVGSRKYTLYGREIAYRLAKECAENGLTIISGLALGIDAFAHQAALDAGGITIGVLGCGLDRIYPTSNFSLGREIVEKGGAIISEFALGTPPMRQNFPARNRIIAGLSSGVLVVEAALESGALITAYQALEYNRDVFAVPGNIGNENAAGTNKLIREGAKLVSKVEDILEEFNIEKRQSEMKAREILPETEDEETIIQVLKGGKKPVDEIVVESGLNIIALNATLTMMEMKGKISNSGGGLYELSN